MRKNTKPINNDHYYGEKLRLDDVRHVIQAGNHPPFPGKDLRSACVFLLFSEREELYITLILKADNEGYPWANQVALPGGHIDSGEDPVTAVYRELEEELQITPPHVEMIGSMGHFLTINNTEIEVFTGIWDEAEKIRFDTKEIAKVYTIPFSWLIDTHFSNRFSGRQPGWEELLYPIDTNVVMWGATAKIMHYLIESIYT